MTEDAKTEKSGTSDNIGTEDEVRMTPEKLGITMDKRVDLAVAAAVTFVGAFMLTTSRDIRRGAIPDPVGERGLPDAVATFLLIAGIVLIVNRLRTWRALPGHFVVEEGKKDDEGAPGTWVRAFSIIAAGLLWVWLFNPLGYLFTMTLFMAAFSLIMGERSLGKIIVYPIAYTVVTCFVFSQLLHIVVLLGPLNNLARSLGLMP